MSLKDIEYASQLLNKSAQILFKKIDMDMDFLNTILDNKQHLSKKLSEIQNNILIHADLLSLGHRLAIEYMKMTKKTPDEVAFILESIAIPFAQFKKMFAESKNASDVNKIYKEFMAVSCKIRPSKKGKGEAGFTFSHNKLVMGGEAYAGGFRSELLLADILEKNKHEMDTDTYMYIMKDILKTDDVAAALSDLSANFTSAHIITMFKLDELFTIQAERYNALPIAEYFATQRSKYITDAAKPTVLGGQQLITLKDYLPELIELDVDCVDDLITQYIITITNISTDDELVSAADNIIAMLENSDAINQYKYRAELKKEIATSMEYITQHVLDSSLSAIIPAVFPSNVKDVIQFLIKALTDLMPTLTQLESVYDECAVRLAHIIDTWAIIIGPDVTPCIKHAEYTIKIYVGSILLQELASVKFTNDDVCQRMSSVQSRMVPIINVDTLPIYTDGKFIWDNIRTNISHIIYPASSNPVSVAP